MTTRTLRARRRSAVPGKRCHYCLGVARTLDHIVPKSKGGPGVRWNFVRACNTCNEAKGNTWPTCTCERCLSAVEMFNWWQRKGGERLILAQNILKFYLREREAERSLL